MTTWEVLVLHPCEHHLDPMSAKCSIYSHERWIHMWIATYETWLNEFDLKTSQSNHDSNITIWLAVEIISYLSTDELKGLSNKWFIRHKIWWRFCKWGCKLWFNHGGKFVVKCAQAGVVLGWVTFQGILVLHLCEHHINPMSSKCFIYSHERWIHMWITTHDTWVNELD